MPVGVDECIIDSGGDFLRQGGGGSRRWATCGVAGSELSVGRHYFIHSPGQALGILVSRMRNLIWIHEKFKEVSYLVQAFKLDSRKSNQDCLRLSLCSQGLLGFFPRY